MKYLKVLSQRAGVIHYSDALAKCVCECFNAPLELMGFQEQIRALSLPFFVSMGTAVYLCILDRTDIWPFFHNVPHFVVKHVFSLSI